MSSYMTLPRIKLLNSVTSWMLHINKILNKISFKGTNAKPPPTPKKKADDLPGCIKDRS